jgi:Rieske Fe-S protein
MGRRRWQRTGVVGATGHPWAPALRITSVGIHGPRWPAEWELNQVATLIAQADNQDTLGANMGEALRPTRRTILTAAAATGAAGLLGACGGDEGTEAGAGGTTAAPETATTTAAPTQQASPTQQPGAGSGAEALAKVGDVAVGGGVINSSAKVVITQPAQGQFKGFSAVCKHQGCLVDRVQNSQIICPCHGSRYSAEDGSVQNPPATTGLDVVQVRVEGDSIVRA